MDSLGLGSEHVSVGDLLEHPQVVGVVEVIPGLPEWKAHQPCWISRDVHGQMFLVSRPGVLGVEEWTLRGFDADGSSHVLRPAPDAELVAPDLCDQGCWRIGAEPLAAIDLYTPHGQRRILGFGRVGSRPLPECAEADAVPEVTFASDLEGVLHMFALADHARGWVVECTGPDGWTAEAPHASRFVGHHPMDPHEVCWDIQRARFGTVHVRLPERPELRVLVRDGRRLAH